MISLKAAISINKWSMGPRSDITYVQFIFISYIGKTDKCIILERNKEKSHVKRKLTRNLNCVTYWMEYNTQINRNRDTHSDQIGSLVQIHHLWTSSYQTCTNNILFKFCNVAKYINTWPLISERMIVSWKFAIKYASRLLIQTQHFVSALIWKQI